MEGSTPMNPIRCSCMSMKEGYCKGHKEGNGCRFIGNKDYGANIFCPYEWQCTLNYPGRYD